MIGDEGEHQKYKMIIILVVVLLFSIVSYSIMEDRYINIPPVNLIKHKTTVDVYSNDVVLITNTETNSTLNAVSWYILAKVEYIDFSSRIIDTRTTTLQEYIKSIP